MSRVFISTRFVSPPFYPHLWNPVSPPSLNVTCPGPRMSPFCPVSVRPVRCKSAHRQLLNFGRKATAASKLKTTRLPRCITPRYCCSTQPKTTSLTRGYVLSTHSFHDHSRIKVWISDEKKLYCIFECKITFHLCP